MERRLLSITEVSQYLGIKEGTIYHWVSQRRIPYVKIGRLTKFDLHKINDFINEMTVEKKEKRIKIA